ncbi:MAG: hypothetical protein M3P50_07155 [Actinomycetota bacterium]|nr:hypothetical protein [Actinomycetota bacterium]
MPDVAPLVHVTAVEVIGEHALRLTFEDGVVGEVASAITSGASSNH